MIKHLLKGIERLGIKISNKCFSGRKWLPASRAIPDLTGVSRRAGSRLNAVTQERKSGGYGGIVDPEEYVNAEYGPGWIESETAYIAGVYNFIQAELEEDANNCTLASITRVMKYYSDIGYSGIPSDIEEIYEKVREIGIRYGYDPKKTGLIRDLFVYTAWEIDNMVKDTWKAFGYSMGGSDNEYFCKLKTIKANIINSNPLLLNIAFGYYEGHTVNVTGYRVFSKGGQKDRVFVLVYDGWSKAVRYIDWTKFGCTPANVTRFLPPQQK